MRTTRSLGDLRSPWVLGYQPLTSCRDPPSRFVTLGILQVRIFLDDIKSGLMRLSRSCVKFTLFYSQQDVGLP